MAAKKAVVRSLCFMPSKIGDYSSLKSNETELMQ
jgi:hypothetical protein